MLESFDIFKERSVPSGMTVWDSIENGVTKVVYWSSHQCSDAAGAQSGPQPWLPGSLTLPRALVEYPKSLTKLAPSLEARREGGRGRVSVPRTTLSSSLT